MHRRDIRRPGAGRRVARAAAVLLLLGLAACDMFDRPVAEPRYVVGAPYELGGVWSYPREEFELVETGLATVAADRRAGRRTANGELHDPARLTAAHRTLQLPAILRVVNLENGLELDVRLNDRGPARPGRVVELSRRAAALLGIEPDQPARVRISVVREPSQAFAAVLPSADARPVEIALAPLGAVQREDLAPPPGAVQAARLRAARPFPGAARGAEVAFAPTLPPERMPEELYRVRTQPTRLFVQGSTFGRRDLAERQAARIGGRVEAIGPRHLQEFRVRIGPFERVAEADQALESALRAGVSDIRIVVD